MQRVDHLLRALLHLDDEAVDLCDEVVVGDVDRDRDGQTARRRDERDLDAARHGGCLHFSGQLDRLEGLDHPDHRS